jgi:hypothetical protein
MSILDNLSFDSEAVEAGDVVASASRESGIYDDTVKLAYLLKSEKGASAVCLVLEDGSNTFTSTVYFTKSGAEAGQTWYERDGKKHVLPGLELLDSLCVITTGKRLKDQDTETRVVPVWNREANAKVNTEVQALTSVMGKRVKTGIVKQTVNKTEYSDVLKKRIDLPETRDEVVIDKFFDSEGKTVTEIAARSDASYILIWSKRNAGVIRNRVKEVKGAPKAAATAAIPAQMSELFK